VATGSTTDLGGAAVGRAAVSLIEEGVSWVEARNGNARENLHRSFRGRDHFNPAIEIDDHDAAPDLVGNLREEFTPR